MYHRRVRNSFTKQLSMMLQKTSKATSAAWYYQSPRPAKGPQQTTQVILKHCKPREYQQ